MRCIHGVVTKVQVGTRAYVLSLLARLFNRRNTRLTYHRTWEKGRMGTRGSPLPALSFLAAETAFLPPAQARTPTSKTLKSNHCKALVLAKSPRSRNKMTSANSTGRDTDWSRAMNKFWIALLLLGSTVGYASTGERSADVERLQSAAVI